jgi:ribosome biogenesis protein ENP2
MHGYFLSLKLYDAARVIANPYVYEEHRAKMVQEKLDKLAEGRIRTRKDRIKVKVNKALAEKIAQEEGRTKKREERKRKKATEDGDVMDVDVDEVPAVKQKTTLLSDSRFAALFEDPEFEVDEESREYALLNPSAAAQKRGRAPEVEGKGWGRGKTAVEDEEDESDKISSDGLSESGSESSGDKDDDENGPESEDSSEAGGMHASHFFFALVHFSSLRMMTHAPSDLVASREQPSSARRTTNPNVRLVPLQAQSSTASGRTAAASSRDAPFGHRRSASARQHQRPNGHPTTGSNQDEHIHRKGDGSVEVSWVPTPGSSRAGAGPGDDEDDEDERGLVGGRSRGKMRASKEKDVRKGVERFGAGMEKGGEDPNMRTLSEQERRGRTQRRRGMRSGSKNVFRQNAAQGRRRPSR